MWADHVQVAAEVLVFRETPSFSGNPKKLNDPNKGKFRTWYIPTCTLWIWFWFLAVYGVVLCKDGIPSIKWYLQEKLRPSTSPLILLKGPRLNSLHPRAKAVPRSFLINWQMHLSREERIIFRDKPLLFLHTAEKCTQFFVLSSLVCRMGCA